MPQGKQASSEESHYASNVLLEMQKCKPKLVNNAHVFAASA